MTRRDGEALGFDLMHFPASFYFPTIFFFFFFFFFLLSLLSLVWSRLLLIGRRLSSLIKSIGSFLVFMRARLAGGFYLFFSSFDEREKR